MGTSYIMKLREKLRDDGEILTFAFLLLDAGCKILDACCWIDQLKIDD